MPSFSSTSLGQCSINSFEIDTGLLLWLDSEVNVTESGGLVSAWDDKRSNGVGFTSSGSLRPTKSTGAITASGAQSMTNSTLPIGTSYSIFVVANLTTSSGYQRLVNYRTGDYGLFFGANNSSFATFCGNGSSSWNDQNSNSPNQSLSATYTILAAINNSTTLTPYFAKTAQNTKTGNTASFTGMILFTGGAGGSSQYWNGSLRELLIYNTALESDSRDAVFNYLSTKYSL
jgi:hypothetical protein